MNKSVFAPAVTILLFASAILSAHGWNPSDAAKANFTVGDGLSWRVAFDKGAAVLSRPRRHLPLETYKGTTDTILTIAFSQSAEAGPAIKKSAWDYLQAEYPLSRGSAVLTVNRLCPAVLLQSPAKSAAFNCPAGPAFIAFVRGGKPAVYETSRLASLSPGDFSMSEPWIVAWFAAAAPAKAHIRPHDVENELGVSKGPTGYNRPPDAVDVPILFRLEHKAVSIRRAGQNGLVLTFAENVGKIAVMPLAGGRLFGAAETEKWSAGLPADIIEQCRRWSARLRDYPISVAEDFKIDPSGDAITIENDFNWVSFDDDWSSPAVKAAPLPPMLALALGSGAPVEFFRPDGAVEPADYGFMDTAGKAMAIESADSYTYRITGLNELIQPAKRTTDATDPDARALRQKLERRVKQMIDAGPLAPLLYIYGGIGGTWFSHFYWSTGPELAQAMAMAYPHLSGPLRAKAAEYLRSEWKTNPPFEFNRDRYTKGKLRTPYEFPWSDMRQLTYALNREQSYRRSDHLFNLYGIDAYLRVTGEQPDAELKGKLPALAGEMLAKQDWAIMGPARIATPRDRHSFLYYNLQGSATYNRWLAGAIGLTRIARRYGWENEEKLGYYLVAKLAVARIAQARYVSEMHRHGLIRGDAKDDNRTLLHIDTACAVIGRGPLEVGVHQNQEIPPFYDLTEEVGRLLGKYAAAECRIYLDHLDHSLPLWYIGEAPKQQATEHRTSPLQNYNGNVLAQYWILGKRRDAFTRYVDTTRFLGDLYHIQNLAAAINSYTRTPGE